MSGLLVELEVGSELKVVLVHRVQLTVLPVGLLDLFAVGGHVRFHGVDLGPDDGTVVEATHPVGVVLPSATDGAQATLPEVPAVAEIVTLPGARVLELLGGSSLFKSINFIMTPINPSGSSPEMLFIFLQLVI